MSERTLSDADIEAIAEALETRVKERFFRDFGKGVFAWIVRGLITLALFFVAYGAMRETWFSFGGSVGK